MRRENGAGGLVVATLTEICGDESGTGNVDGGLVMVNHVGELVMVNVVGERVMESVDGGLVMASIYGDQEKGSVGDGQAMASIYGEQAKEIGELVKAKEICCVCHD